MKYILSLSCTVLAFFVLLSVIPVNGEEKIYDNMIRLHIIANSDSEEDQRIKLTVRDGILSRFSEQLAKEGSFGEAYSSVEELLPEIEETAEEILSTNNAPAEVKAEIGEEVYPERIYEGYTLPAGKYVSLRIVIGEGAGKNWWCVLFPPLCTAAASREASEDEEVFIEAGISTEGYKLIKQEKETKYKIRFRILEILSGVLGYEY